MAIVDIFLHLDTHLDVLIAHFGIFTYLIIFLIIFAETGLVFTPFLPGDSLLFAVGALAARGSLDIVLLIALLIVAAIVGDSVNYSIGRALGRSLFTEHRKILNIEHLKKAEKFYAEYGSKAIIFARFLPLFRTLAPFVAGMAKMNYRKFVFWNVVGGIVWVTLSLGAGYFFGQVPAIKHNFSLVILAIICVSFIPAIIEFVRARRARMSRKV